MAQTEMVAVWEIIAAAQAKIAVQLPFSIFSRNGQKYVVISPAVMYN